MIKKFAIGTDIGGSHICCALVDIFEGKIIKDSRSELKIDNKASSDEILKGWVEALSGTIAKAGSENVAGIGFAMPGPFAYERGVALFRDVAKFDNLYNVNVGEELKKRLNTNIPMRFINDASAFAIGEAWLGAASHTTKSVAITLGTGFGSAFICDGLPLIEGVGVPLKGYVAHYPFCDATADDYFSTRWFVKRWRETSGETEIGVKQIAEKAKNNVKAQMVFEEFGVNLATMLGQWLKKFSAEVLVIGGNISAGYLYFGNAFEENLKMQNIDTKITLSTLMEDAAIIGSARLIDNNYFAKIEPILPKMN